LTVTKSTLRRKSDRDAALPALAEVFRTHGFEGASLAVISERTGLGKGSLYNFFPGGKDEMAAAVLAEIDSWFEANIFAPLRSSADPRASIAETLSAIDVYFRSGRRVCLVGALALSDARDRFAAAVRDYFIAWTEALASALKRSGMPAAEASAVAEESVGIIQGALVLARAIDQPVIFERAMIRLRKRLEIDSTDLRAEPSRNRRGRSVGSA
jgi:TetR/AcrR family transcriptional regulator, lmrAB and yxaGH operons repressor